MVMEAEGTALGKGEVPELTFPNRGALIKGGSGVHPVYAMLAG